MKFLNPLFATQPRFTLFLLRVALGFIFFVHGSQLVFGWFGGYGLSASIGEGFEFHLLATAIALTLVIAGGGILSIDRSIAAPREGYR